MQMTNGGLYRGRALLGHISQVHVASSELLPLNGINKNTDSTHTTTFYAPTVGWLLPSSLDVRNIYRHPAKITYSSHVFPPSHSAPAFALFDLVTTD